MSSKISFVIMVLFLATGCSRDNNKQDVTLEEEDSGHSLDSDPVPDSDSATLPDDETGAVETACSGFWFATGVIGSDGELEFTTVDAIVGYTLKTSTAVVLTAGDPFVVDFSLESVNDCGDLLLHNFYWELTASDVTTTEAVAWMAQAEAAGDSATLSNETSGETFVTAMSAPIFEEGLSFSWNDDTTTGEAFMATQLVDGGQTDYQFTWTGSGLPEVPSALTLRLMEADWTDLGTGTRIPDYTGVQWVTIDLEVVP